MLPGRVDDGRAEASATLILDALERRARGALRRVRSGTSGSTERVDLAMVIRVDRDRCRTARRSAPVAGITALSVPAEELAEAKLKAAPPCWPGRSGRTCEAARRFGTPWCTSRRPTASIGPPARMRS